MARSQIDDMLAFSGSTVFARGPFERGPGERMKTFWVRVCQRDHVSGDVTIAEKGFHGESTSVFAPAPTNIWELGLAVVQGQLRTGDATASAVLVFEAGDDLFTLAWAECVHLHEMSPAPGD